MRLGFFELLPMQTTYNNRISNKWKPCNLHGGTVSNIILQRNKRRCRPYEPNRSDVFVLTKVKAVADDLFSHMIDIAALAAFIVWASKIQDGMTENHIADDFSW